MVRLLDSGLDQLTAMVVKSGEVAKKAVDISVCSFMDGKDTIETVRSLSDKICFLTTEIEDKAFELIVKYQPVASDLK